MNETKERTVYEKIPFYDEEGRKVEYYIIEETTLGGESFLLVSIGDPAEDEAEALVLQKTGDDGEEADYVPVEDDLLLRNVLGVFEELLEDTGFEF